MAKVGDLVAAFVVRNKNWILTEVMHYHTRTCCYELDDIDEARPESRRMVLHRRFVIPLPLMRGNPELYPQTIFAAESPVLALYPQTTCFYLGKVFRPPSTVHDPYQIRFRDKTQKDGYSAPMEVHQRYVVRGNKETETVLMRDSDDEIGLDSRNHDGGNSTWRQSKNRRRFHNQYLK